MTVSRAASGKASSGGRAAADKTCGFVIFRTSGAENVRLCRTQPPCEIWRFAPDDRRYGRDTARRGRFVGVHLVGSRRAVTAGFYGKLLFARDIFLVGATPRGRPRRYSVFALLFENSRMKLPSLGSHMGLPLPEPSQNRYRTPPSANAATSPFQGRKFCLLKSFQNIFRP